MKEALDIGKEELTKIMRKAIYEKPKSHHFEDILCEKETKTMNMIGG